MYFCPHPSGGPAYWYFLVLGALKSTGLTVYPEIFGSWFAWLAWAAKSFLRGRSQYGELHFGHHLITGFRGCQLWPHRKQLTFAGSVIVCAGSCCS
jgi:hypothetical protein